MAPDAPASSKVVKGEKGAPGRDKVCGDGLTPRAVAALGVVMTVCVLTAVPETLPLDRRHGGGLRTFVGANNEVHSLHLDGHLFRALLEGCTFALRDIVDAMRTAPNARAAKRSRSPASAKLPDCSYRF